ncbi:MAG: hypothetical protein AAF152_11295 [Cyanobacteria bacterium P01_A01_bin.114]
MATLTLPRGNSATAEYLETTQRQYKNHFHSSAALSKQSAHNELFSILEKCSKQNWDGYDALPVQGVAAQTAYELIEALPLETPLPSVGAEPDGSITLEWYRHPRWILSVSVNSTATTYYAALFGLEKASGAVPFLEEFPATLLNLIQRFQMHD